MGRSVSFTAMHISLPHNLSHPIVFDARRRRLWIFGQRCHHGATGALITATAGAVLARKQTLAGARAASSALAQTATLAVVGSLMMLHDWKDHSFWFEIGRGSQP
jgi:hypothetical protein